MSCLKNNKFITTDQSAYMEHHNTQTALHNVADDWYNDNDNDNDNGNIFISVHLSQGMIINYVHVQYANFALIIVMNLTNFNDDNVMIITTWLIPFILACAHWTLQNVLTL